MTFKSKFGPFRSQLAETVFVNKYRHDSCETWEELSSTLVKDVCGQHMKQDEQDQLIQYISDMKFIPGGRYLYYAGRPKKYFNNCYLLRAEEDTREEWANLSWRSESCLLTGGGIGVDYSRLRPSGSVIKRTGGRASGPISKMKMINEIGRNVMQGGSRRSAIYASLNWKHDDAKEFLSVKNWSDDIKKLKEKDFNFPAPLDMTNISLNYDTEWLLNYWKTGELHETFIENCRQAIETGEPGFSFNFFEKENETLRNACTEVTSEDDSDVCNLGSINLSRIDDLWEFADIVDLSTKFLLCGTLVADLPYEKIRQVREKNRRLGLGLMGIHEWLLKKGYKYEVTPEFNEWLTIYSNISNATARSFSDHHGVSRPVAVRSIAPTGTIGMIAGTTTGIEPIYAVAYKRRYLKNGTEWHYQYAVDSTAQVLIDQGIKPEAIETAFDLSYDFKRRVEFQADVQDYVDQSISSTLNLPEPGSIAVDEFANVVAGFAHRLRGLTVYPNGSRGGQPLTSVDYAEVVGKTGEEFKEEFNDNCANGVCGI